MPLAGDLGGNAGAGVVAVADVFAGEGGGEDGVAAAERGHDAVGGVAGGQAVDAGRRGCPRGAVAARALKSSSSVSRSTAVMPSSSRAVGRWPRRAVSPGQLQAGRPRSARAARRARPTSSTSRPAERRARARSMTHGSPPTSSGRVRAGRVTPQPPGHRDRGQAVQGDRGDDDQEGDRAGSWRRRRRGGRPARPRTSRRWPRRRCRAGPSSR